MFHVEHSEAVDRKSRRRERSKSGGIGPKRHIWANVPCGTQESRWTALDNFGGISDIQFCSTWNILNFVGWTLIELGYAGDVPHGTLEPKQIGVRKVRSVPRGTFATLSKERPLNSHTGVCKRPTQALHKVRAFCSTGEHFELSQLGPLSHFQLLAW
jgi:hypothetical protein